MSSEQEFDAIVLKFRRSQRTKIVKFCSIIVLVGIMVVGVLMLTSMVPGFVDNFMGVK